MTRYVTRNFVWLVAAVCAGTALFAQERDKPKPERPAPQPEQRPAPEREKPQGDKPTPQGERPATPPERGAQKNQRMDDLSPGDQRLNSALDDLSTRIGEKRLEAADYERVRAALRERHMPGEQADPRARARAERFEQSLATFDQRFKNQKLKAAHVDMLREQLVDERLDMAIDRWRNAAAAGKVTEAEYHAVARELKQRAQVAQSFDPEANAMHTRLQARLDEMRNKGNTAPLRNEDVLGFRDELIEMRLQHAIANLERHAAADDLTRADLAHLRGMLEDNAADAAQDAELKALHERMNNAIAGLEQKVAAGKVDPAEVAKLKALMIRKAREASTDSTPKPPKQN